MMKMAWHFILFLGDWPHPKKKEMVGFYIVEIGLWGRVTPPKKNAKKTCLFPISFQKPTENLTNQPQQTNQPTKPTNPTNQPKPTKDASSLTAFDSPNFPELATVGTEVEG